MFSEICCTGAGKRRAGPLYLPAVLMTIVFLLSTAGCFGKKLEGVSVEPAIKTDMEVVITAMGKVESGEKTPVEALTSGTLAVLHVREGDTVDAGQVLASYDKNELAVRLEEARVSHLNAQAMADMASGMWANSISMNQMMQQSASSLSYLQRQIDGMAMALFDVMPYMAEFLPPDKKAQVEGATASARSRYHSAASGRPGLPSSGVTGYPGTAAAADAARVQAAHAAYSQALAAYESAEILAPASGVVVFRSPASLIPSDMVSEMLGGMGSMGSLGMLTGMGGIDIESAIQEMMPSARLEEGSRVSAGSIVFDIVNLQRVDVKVKVNETDVPLVEEGQKARVFIDAYPEKDFTGTLKHVGISAVPGDVGMQAFEAHIELNETDIPMRLGFSSTAEIIADSREGVIAIPSVSIKTIDDDHYVFVVEKGKAKLRKVKLGLETQEMVEIKEGLSEDELIVTEGAYKVEEGDKVI